jgi:transcriptional regulator GlxA family with amidase domain
MYSAGIQEVVSHIEANFHDALPLRRLAEAANLSTFWLVALFRREVGMPPHRYLSHVRVRQAQALLEKGVAPAAAAIQSGFFDQSHFTRHFKRVCGMTPGQYRTASSKSGSGRSRDARIGQTRQSGTHALQRVASVD